MTECFEQDLPDHLFYHNLSHTQSVVAHAREIGKFYKLDDHSCFTLLAAAWFHDIGYLYTIPEQHEYMSVSVMRSFLKGYCSPPTLKEIEGVILATRGAAHPVTLLERIICDADTYHFGTEEFLITDQQVKKEVETKTGRESPGWKTHTFHLLETHQFHTGYCMEKLNEGKKRNIAYLKQ